MQHDEMRSVPPEMELSSTLLLIARYTKSKPSGASGEPVLITVRRAGKATCSCGA